jgi:flagellar hook-associated protein 2
MATDADTMKTRLTQQFASMDAQVAVYKSTLSFLQAQIAAWNAPK